VCPDHCRLETAAGEATSEDVAGSGQEAVDRPFRQPYRRNPPVAVAREAPVARSASARADDAAIEWLGIIQDQAESVGDKLVMGRVARPSSATANFLTFARVLTNRNYNAPSA
jgi:hypothetical protein